MKTAKDVYGAAVAEDDLAMGEARTASYDRRQWLYVRQDALLAWWHAVHPSKTLALGHYVEPPKLSFELEDANAETLTEAPSFSLVWMRRGLVWLFAATLALVASFTAMTIVPMTESLICFLVSAVILTALAMFVDRRLTRAVRPTKRTFVPPLEVSTATPQELDAARAWARHAMPTIAEDAEVRWVDREQGRRFYAVWRGGPIVPAMRPDPEW